MDFEFTVEDANGNTEVVTHQHSVSYTYKQLHDEVNEDLFNASDVITTALDTTSDFNPLDTIEEIEDHFHLHRYGYTRLLLSVLEKEQIMDVIEHLAVEGDGRRLALSRLVDTNPLAVTENFLILKLRELAPNKQEPTGLRATCVKYAAELKNALHRGSRWDRSETVYLPTAGLFGEAILGRSNASEFLDMRRFFNWIDSPIPNAAPAVNAVDLNQLRAAAVAAGLSPNVPDSTLAQVLPTAYPMPSSLASALQAIQNGQMFTDMSKTSDFASILGNLSELANNSARLAGNLSGDAMAKALDSAVALGGQVAAMTQDAMARTSASPPDTLTEKGAQVNNVGQVSDTPTPPSELSEIDKARIAAGGTDVTPPCPDKGTPTPSPSPTPSDPEPPDTPDDGPPSATRLPLALSVPYPSVRLDITNAAWSAIPAGVRDVFGQGLTLMGTWVYAIGFDDEGGFDVIKEALEAFAIAVPGIGEIVVAVEGLKAVVDFVGLDPDVSSATAQLGIDLAANVMNTLQSLVFPALKGDDWLSATIKVEVTDGVPTATIDRWVPKGIPYGFLAMSEQAEGGPWWSGDSWSALMLSTTYISRDSLTTSARLDTDGALLVNLKLSAPLQLSWAGVLAQQTSKLVAQVASLMSDAGVAAGVAAALGVTDAEQELVARINGAFEWMRTNVVAVLDQYFTPHIDMDLTVRIEESGSDWQVTVSGTHDYFPSYVLSLNGPEGAVEELYAGPEGLESSAEGPAALILPYSSSTGDPMITVPGEWIANWNQPCDPGEDLKSIALRFTRQIEEVADSCNRESPRETHPMPPSRRSG